MSCEDPERNVVEDTKPGAHDPARRDARVGAWRRKRFDSFPPAQPILPRNRLWLALQHQRFLDLPRQHLLPNPGGSRMRLNEVDVLRRVKVNSGIHPWEWD